MEPEERRIEIWRKKMKVWVKDGLDKIVVTPERGAAGGWLDEKRLKERGFRAIARLGITEMYTGVVDSRDREEFNELIDSMPVVLEAQIHAMRKELQYLENKVFRLEERIKDKREKALEWD